MTSSPTSRPSSRARRPAHWGSATAASFFVSYATGVALFAQPSGERTGYVVASRVEDAQTGDEWVATLGGGLQRRTGGRMDVFDQLNSGLPGNVVYSVALGVGRVFAATNGGTCRFDPHREEWELLDPRRSDRPQPAVIDIRWDDHRLLGRLWGSGVVAWDEASRTWTSTEIAWPDRVEAKVSESAPARPEPPFRHPNKLAVLGPGSRRMALPGDELPNRQPIPQPDLVAAQQAVSRANRRFGLADDVGFAVADTTPGYDRYGWRLLEDDLVRCATQRDVAGVIAHLDERSAYTEAAGSALHIPMVNISDRNSPLPDGAVAERWTFRCRGDDALRNRQLLDAVASLEGRRRWTVIYDPSNAERRLRANWTRRYARHLGLPEVTPIEWNERSAENSMEKFREAASDAVFIVADARRATEWIRALRSKGVRALIVLESDAVDSIPAETLGADAGPILASASRNASARSSTSPSSGSISIRTSAAADHLLSAMHRSEGDRDSVRRVLMDMEEDPFGEAHAEAHQQFAGGVLLARWVDGRWVYETASPDPDRREP